MHEIIEKNAIDILNSVLFYVLDSKYCFRRVLPTIPYTYTIL